MILILIGLLIGLIIFIKNKKTKDNIGFLFMQIIFFSFCGLFVSLLISFLDLVPTNTILIKNENLQTLSNQTYLEVEEKISFNETLKKDTFQYKIIYKIDNIIYKDARPKTVKINLIKDEENPSIKIYKDTLKNENLKYLFFEIGKKSYIINVNKETYEHLKFLK